MNTEFNGLLSEDQGIRIKLQPFKVYLNQSVLLFLLDFFDVNLQSSQPKEPKTSVQVPINNQKEVYINQLTIHPTYVMLTYTSTTLKFTELGKNPLEFLNVLNLKDLRLDFKPYSL